jgi:phospholipid transport system substrate-binding protein
VLRRSIEVATLSILFLLISFFLQAEAQADGASPTETIKTKVDEIISSLHRESLTADNKWKIISDRIKDSFDFRSMSQSLLETHWDKASPEEKRLCVEYFSQYLETIYRKHIESHTNHSVRYAGESINGKNAVVNTFIIGDSDEIPVSYKMRQNNGEWTVYDVLINEVSLMDSHRSVLSSILQSEGIEGLFRTLQNTNLKYKDD